MLIEYTWMASHKIGRLGLSAKSCVALMEFVKRGLTIEAGLGFRVTRQKK